MSSRTPHASSPTARFTARLLGKTFANGSARPTIRPSDKTRPISWPNAMTSRACRGPLACSGEGVCSLTPGHRPAPSKRYRGRTGWPGSGLGNTSSWIQARPHTAEAERPAWSQIGHRKRGMCRRTWLWSGTVGTRKSRSAAVAATSGPGAAHHRTAFQAGYGGSIPLTRSSQITAFRSSNAISRQARLLNVCQRLRLSSDVSRPGDGLATAQHSDPIPAQATGRHPDETPLIATRTPAAPQTLGRCGSITNRGSLSRMLRFACWLARCRRPRGRVVRRIRPASWAVAPRSSRQRSRCRSRP